MAAAILTHARLLELLHYDPETGVFVWRIRRGRAQAGDIAGTRISNGYLHASIDRSSYFCHRLAWLYVRGAWPTNHIDHINGIRTDNRICNLRDVTRSTNMQNLRRALSNSKSGLIGATPHGSGWRARIRPGDGLPYMSLGTFRTAEEAHAAYIAAKRELHRGNML